MKLPSFIRQAAFKTALALSQIDAAKPNYKRPYRPVTIQDFRRNVSQSDFRTILSHSRELYLNLGPAKGAVVDKAVYSVGRAWRPRFTGENAEWGAQAAQWLTDQWYRSCDIAGGMHDFVTDLLLMSIALDRDGDFGILLTEGKNGWPMFQVIPAHRIWSDSSAKAPQGFQWDKGILFSASGTPVTYRILTGEDKDPTDYRDVSAQDFIHVYDPEWFAQGRGMPAFTHAIFDLQDYQTIQGFEKQASMIASSITMLETNPDGGPDPSQLRSVVEEQISVENGLRQEVLEGGTIRYFKSNDGSKLEAWQHNRPGTATTDFLDRLLRNALVGIGWPYELIWNAKDARGANIRSIVARAARTVEDRQDLLKTAARRLVGYAVAKAIKRGILPESAEWWKWDFTMPPHITVDAGYDAAADREDYKLGFKNLSDILAKWGKDPEQHLRERAREEQMIQRIAEEEGVDPEKLRNLGLQKSGL